MAISATPKWKTQVLTVPGFGSVNRPHGEITYPSGVETWLVEQGYAIALSTRKQRKKADKTNNETNEENSEKTTADTPSEEVSTDDTRPRKTKRKEASEPEAES